MCKPFPFFSQIQEGRSVLDKINITPLEGNSNEVYSVLAVHFSTRFVPRIKYPLNKHYINLKRLFVN